ncbi:MAG: FecR family protein [Thermodesulfobacteriota bacterium]
MLKTVKKIIPFLIFITIQMVIPISVLATMIGEFTSVTGTVSQIRATEEIKPVKQSPIQIKDVVITGQRSSAMMSFSDHSMIKLEQDSKLEIDQFLFENESRKAHFLLTIGKVVVNVSKFIGGENTFEVRTPTSVTAVRGTGFELIEAKDEGKAKSTVSCTEGSLNLSALSDTGAVVSTAVLEAGQMAVISGGIITISMIGEAVAAGVGATAAETGSAATAAAGWSTGAIIGTAAAGIVGAGAIVAAANDDGGSDGTESTTSTWVQTDTYRENTCGFPNQLETRTSTVTETESTFTLVNENGFITSGTIIGDTSYWTSVIDDGNGVTTTVTGTRIRTSDTTSTYSYDWIRTDGTTSCGGHVEGTGVKIQ